MPYLNLLYIQSGTVAEVCYQLFAFFRNDQLDFIIQDQFAGYMFQPAFAFQQPGDKNKDTVCHNQFDITDLCRQGIDNGQGDNDEEIRHFADRD